MTADFQSQGTLAVRNEVLIMNVTGLTTISAESFNRHAGMRSKPQPSQISGYVTATEQTPQRSLEKLKGGYWRTEVLGSHWLWPQADRKVAINLVALAMHCLSEDTKPFILMFGDVTFFSPGRIFFIVLQNDLRSPPLSSMSSLL